MPVKAGIAAFITHQITVAIPAAYFSFPWTFFSHRSYVLINYQKLKKKPPEAILAFETHSTKIRMWAYMHTCIHAYAHARCQKPSWLWDKHHQARYVCERAYTHECMCARAGHQLILLLIQCSDSLYYSYSARILSLQLSDCVWLAIRPTASRDILRTKWWNTRILYHPYTILSLQQFAIQQYPYSSLK